MSLPSSIAELVAKWESNPNLAPFGKTSSGRTLYFFEILEWMEYAEREWFSDYVPVRSTGQPLEYFDRLLLWIGNEGLNEADAPLLFEFASQLLFFSADDFLALYRTAFTGPITRWVSEQANITLDSDSWDLDLQHQRDDRTWFCPITDSMDISGFYHLNQLTGISHRPGFRSLVKFRATKKSIRVFMRNEDLDRLVLLEDFVGTGSQTAEIVRWAVSSTEKPVLFVPLIVAPDGLCRLRNLEAEFYKEKLQVQPVVELENADFVGSAASTDPLFSKILDLTERVHPFVRGAVPNNRNTPPFSHLGFHRSGDSATGATVVLHTNCPNNSVPIIHHSSTQTQWRPLFPRVDREPKAS